MSSKNFDLSKLLQKSPDLNRSQKIKFIWSLSVPGILAQISSIIMQYIDAAMVGSIGEEAPAAIGLVASSTWVLSSLSHAMSIGFTIQVAHAVGKGDQESAKRIFLKSISFCFIFSLILTLLSASISGILPTWLNAEESLKKDASLYFLVFALSTPFYQMIYLMSGMLQCSGNMKVPSILNSLLCIFDALFNIVFIKIFGLGVLGAALGSAVSSILICASLLYAAVHKSSYIGLTCGRKPKKDESATEDKKSINIKALKLATPIAVEKVAFTGVLVVITKLIAPFGAVSLAANSFAVTSEALCYMPGYGISEAATTLVGQSVGAKRKDLTNSFSWITVLLGIGIMFLTGILMYAICPFVFKLLTPFSNIQELSIKILRIELFAEPLYGASIVETGALRGQDDTFVPSLLNLFSLWVVRLGLSILLVKKMALVGIWIAMAIELCFRGTVMLLRLWWKSKRAD